MIVSYTTKNVSKIKQKKIGVRSEQLNDVITSLLQHVTKNDKNKNLSLFSSMILTAFLNFMRPDGCL